MTVDLVLLGGVALIGYCITAAPGIFLLRYFRGQVSPVLKVVSALVAALLISPALVSFAHMLAVVPFGLALLIDDRIITPDPFPWNAAVSASFFLGALLFSRKRRVSL